METFEPRETPDNSLGKLGDLESAKRFLQSPAHLRMQIEQQMQDIQEDDERTIITEENDMETEDTDKITPIQSRESWTDMRPFEELDCKRYDELRLRLLEKARADSTQTLGVLH